MDGLRDQRNAMDAMALSHTKAMEAMAAKLKRRRSDDGDDDEGEDEDEDEDEDEVIDSSDPFGYGWGRQWDEDDWPEGQPRPRSAKKARTSAPPFRLDPTPLPGGLAAHPYGASGAAGAPAPGVAAGAAGALAPGVAAGAAGAPAPAPVPPTLTRRLSTTWS